MHTNFQIRSAAKALLPLLVGTAFVALVIAGAADQKSDAAAKAAAEKKAKQDAAKAKAEAQKNAKATKGVPRLESPQPVLAWVFPAGGQRGQTFDVTATGTDL